MDVISQQRRIIDRCCLLFQFLLIRKIILRCFQFVIRRIQQKIFLRFLIMARRLMVRILDFQNFQNGRYRRIIIRLKLMYRRYWYNFNCRYPKHCQIISQRNQSCLRLFKHQHFAQHYHYCRLIRLRFNCQRLRF